jgi:hypothetical protein
MAFLEQIASRRIQLALNGLTPHKAKIVNLSSKKTFLNNSIEVSFNPNKIDFSTCAKYPEDYRPGGDSLVTYGGNMASEISMKLLFDTTMTGSNVRKKYIDFLVELLQPIPDKTGKAPQPPHCQFIWGDFSDGHLNFEGVLTNLKVDYEWFLPNGRPVRADVNVTFKSPTEKKGGTNPTSRSEARSVWRVIEGQTLDWIAYQEYGDSSAWRHIAQVNNLSNPRDLRPGMVLKLVPLP